MILLSFYNVIIYFFYYPCNFVIKLGGIIHRLAYLLFFLRVYTIYDFVSVFSKVNKEVQYKFNFRCILFYVLIEIGDNYYRRYTNAQ